MFLKTTNGTKTYWITISPIETVVLFFMPKGLTTYLLKLLIQTLKPSWF